MGSRTLQVEGQKRGPGGKGFGVSAGPEGQHEVVENEERGYQPKKAAFDPGSFRELGSLDQCQLQSLTTGQCAWASGGERKGSNEHGQVKKYGHQVGG